LSIDRGKVKRERERERKKKKALAALSLSLSLRFPFPFLSHLFSIASSSGNSFPCFSSHAHESIQSGMSSRWAGSSFGVGRRGVGVEDGCFLFFALARSPPWRRSRFHHHHRAPLGPPNSRPRPFLAFIPRSSKRISNQSPLLRKIELRGAKTRSDGTRKERMVSSRETLSPARPAPG